MNFLDCWIEAAAALFSQALAGEPELVESFPRPLEAGSFGFAASLDGDIHGRFSITIDAAVLDAPLLGEGQEQKTAWGEVLQETCAAACGKMLSGSGIHCRVAAFEPGGPQSQVSRALQLRSGDRSWIILVRDETRQGAAPADRHAAPEPAAQVAAASAREDSSSPALSSGVELLLDVELEATLRFGCREMPLGEILDLGPGDVVQLDRHVSDPVDLIVGDKIVARGDVVLVNGNFGLRVNEVAVPRKRLESIRCLF